MGQIFLNEIEMTKTKHWTLNFQLKFEPRPYMEMNWKCIRFSACDFLVNSPGAIHVILYSSELFFCQLKIPHNSALLSAQKTERLAFWWYFHCSFHKMSPPFNTICNSQSVYSQGKTFVKRRKPLLIILTLSDHLMIVGDTLVYTNMQIV